MTKDRIEFMRQGAEEILRLLDEREALLDALRELSRRASDPDLLRGISGARLMLEGAVKEADAVIAKVEAE